MSGSFAGASANAPIPGLGVGAVVVRPVLLWNPGPARYAPNLQEISVKSGPSTVAKSKISGYSGRAMSDERGQPTRPIIPGRENAGGVGARLRRELSPEQLDAVLEESSLGHALKRYERQLREIELPAGGFKSKEQADAGGRLAQSLRELQNVQAGFGIPATEAPERVMEAERMAGAYRRTHDKTGAFIPPRPRGRPRRVVQEAATASVG